MLDGEAALDAEQAEAASASNDGSVCVVAGAGSGKTRALLGRVRHLLASGVSASDIVLCTFTQRAAAEMATRLNASAPQASALNAGTLHQVAYRLLARHGHLIGMSRFTVLAADESLRMLDTCLAALPSPRPSARQLAAAYHRAVAEERPLAEAIAERRQRGQSWTGTGATPIGALEAVLDDFARTKARRGALDFDDLLFFGKLLLLEHRAQIGPMRHVLVDEYQDIDPLQAEILGLLAGADGALWAVGDPAQAIYGFRGASGALLATFRRAPGVRTIALRHSYRASAELVALGNRVRARIDGVQLLAHRPRSGSPASVVACADPDDEATLIAARLRRALAAGIAPADMAVLYRSHRQRRRLAEALAAAGVPVRAAIDDATTTPTLMGDGVALCTVHQAKGLEWHTVVVAGLHEGGFPVGGDADLDEERRLFYVAVTRARDQLVLSHPVEQNGRALVPSRFVLELS